MAMEAQRFERDDYDLEYVAPPPRHGGVARGLMTVAVAILVMAVFAGGLWFAYRELTRFGGGGAVGTAGVNTPIIQAPDQPTKKRPVDEGGLKIPDQDKLIYGSRGAPAPGFERLLPVPEQPLALPPPVPVLAPAPVPALAPPSSAPVVASSAAAPAAVAPTGAAPTGVAPTGVAPTGVAPSSAAPPPASVAPTRLAELTPAAGPHRLQLASVKTPEAAKQEWDRIRRANGDLLGKLEVRTVRTDLGEKGIYWRVQAGPIAEQAEAARICNELKKRNVACLLARP